MRNTLLLLSLIMFFSCSHPENSLLPVLSRADLLLQIGYADSALILLDSFPVDDLTTVSLQARHALLLTQAMDKNYITLTGDSLIRIAVKYYDSTNDLSSRAKAHYYWGRVHQDMGDVEGTVREFLTAMPLAKKAKEAGVQKTASGLLYKVIKEGKGEKPVENDKVTVSYKGTLIDGTEFDSSYKRNEPATFRANQVIKGWTEALTMMPVGSKWELYIPQELAYGSRESGQIKPFSTLIFEVELVGIEKDKK